MDIWKNFNSYYADLYCFARRMLFSHEKAEDIAQETILRFVRDKSGRLNGEPARKWLFVVARNLCISDLRSSSKNREIPIENHERASGSDPSVDILEDERNKKIEQALSQLSDDMREIIILREYEGMNYREISGIINCPAGTVKSRLARARTELQKLLAPFMED